MSYNVDKIRADFPILSREIYGKPLIYLDNAATTQKPRQVVEKISESYYTINSNIHRAVHYLSDRATVAYEDSRKEVQGFINAKSEREIVFTRGSTESINLIASSFTKRYLEEGDEIIISEMEHHSNIVPWQMRCGPKKVKINVIPINDNGALDIEAFEKLISEKTKLVSVTYVSNSLGTLNPVEEIITIAHKYNVPVLIDAAQAVQHIEIDVQALDADFLVFSGHKMYGPTGIGILYGKEKWLEELPPYQGGGEMIKKVTFEKTTFNELPFKFEAGTADYIGAIGLAEAIRYIKSIGLKNIAEHEKELLAYGEKALSSIADLRIYGQAPNKCSVISFNVKGIHSFDMGTLLDKNGIAVRTGNHCAQPVIDHFKTDGMVRASFAMYNKREEFDTLAATIEKIKKLF